MVGRLAGKAGRMATRAGAWSFRAGFGQNALMGAAAGGAVGAANPMGNDGPLRGAVRGAMYGAGLGSLGYGGAKLAQSRGMRKLGLGSFSASTKTGQVSARLPGRSRAIRAGNLGVYGGALGGALGGSRRRSKRGKNTTIASNSWKHGTHPMYFR
jgi:hypothetical protein